MTFDDFILTLDEQWHDTHNGYDYGKAAWDAAIKSTKIPLKDQFTAGLQFQVAKINRLEKLCDNRQKIINRLRKEIKDLRGMF